MPRIRTDFRTLILGHYVFLHTNVCLNMSWMVGLHFKKRRNCTIYCFLTCLGSSFFSFLFLFLKEHPVWETNSKQSSSITHQCWSLLHVRKTKLNITHGHIFTLISAKNILKYIHFVLLAMQINPLWVNVVCWLYVWGKRLSHLTFEDYITGCIPNTSLHPTKMHSVRHGVSHPS